jgi:DNA replication protein DnaC
MYRSSNTKRRKTSRVSSILEYNTNIHSIPEIRVDNNGYSKELQDLIEILQTSAGLKMYKAAYRQNMLNKITRYSNLQKKAEEDVNKEIQVIKLKTPELKRIAHVEGEHDNWLIFESLSEQYREAKGRAAAFEAIKMRAHERLEGSMSVDEIRNNDIALTLRDDLVSALRVLTNFSSQRHVVGKTVDIVSSFIKNPTLFHTKLMNFMLLGGAGTGKTTIASVIGDVFAKAGIFVGNKLIEAGRAELVGQYEGQTVARTRNFLVSNLDNGVIFIDEAYAITPWQNGKPEGYGAEAATAMVEFMTRYPGLYCIIVAGYETQMIRYFLPTNEGLSRRFPNKYVLRDMSAKELIEIFKRALLKFQGLQVPDGKNINLESTSYFNDDAWSYLENLIYLCTRGITQYTEEFDTATLKTYHHVLSFKPNFEFLYTIFENQAGSMTNLADEAITVLMGMISYKQVIDARKKNSGINVCPLIQQQPRSVMRHIVVQTIIKSSFSHYTRFLAQLEQVETLIR